MAAKLQLFQMDSRALQQTHRQNQADATVAVIPVAREKASGFGRGFLASMGICLFGRGVRIPNAAGVQHADGSGHYMRDGIVIVPKGGVVPDGTEI